MIYISNNHKKKQSQKKSKIKNSDSKLTQSHTYSFPIKLLQHQTLQNQYQFKKLLRTEAFQLKLSDKGWAFTKHTLITGQFRMYIRCYQCKAKIIYRINQNDSWTLINYNNHHNHSVQSRKSRGRLSQVVISQNINLPNDDLYKIVNNSYPMDRNYFLKKKRQLLKNSSFQLMKNLFQRYGYDSRYQEDDIKSNKQQYPYTIVASSNQHKQNYKKYGDCLCFDIISNCLKQITHKGKRFGVAIFSGFDNNNRTILFGIAISIFETQDDYLNTFNWFFDMMGKINTSAIISNNQKILVNIIQKLREQFDYRFYHVYNNEQILKLLEYSVRKIQINEYENISTKVILMIKQSDPKIGQQKLNQLRQFFLEKNCSEQFQKMICDLDHICLWKMPKQFIGLSLNSHLNTTDPLKLKGDSEQYTNIPNTIQRFQKYSKKTQFQSFEVTIKQIYPFQITFRDDLILQVRQTFQKIVFEYFIHRFNQSQFYQTINSQGQDHFLLQNAITLRKYNINNWECECGILEKTGIPCQHIILIFCLLPLTY